MAFAAAQKTPVTSFTQADLDAIVLHREIREQMAKVEAAANRITAAMLTMA